MTTEDTCPEPAKVEPLSEDDSFHTVTLGKGWSAGFDEPLINTGDGNLIVRVIDHQKHTLINVHNKQIYELVATIAERDKTIEELEAVQSVWKSDEEQHQKLIDYIHAHSNFDDPCGTVYDSLEEIIDEATGLREALEKFGRHALTCIVFRLQKDDCDCGLDAAKKGEK